MCGIAGFRSAPQGDFLAAVEVARTLQAALQHRGPDCGGEWGDSAQGIGLHHRMLSIIGSGADSSQPMHSQDKRFVIAFNGEIYNYRELADQLELPKDSSLRRSDTAVFLNGISRWGLAECLRRAVGMFAFGLWDNKDKQLYLVRDPVGKRPLYYGRFKNSLFFASELAPFRAVPELQLSISSDSLSRYLSLGFVPTPDTIFSEVKMLGAGTIGRVDLDLNLSTELYHDFRKVTRRTISFEAAVEESEQLLRDSVRLRLRSDVPLGCFLSGGIDSGLIVAAAAEQLSRPLRTYSISVGGSGMDEGALAEATAKRYSTDHTEISVRADIEKILPHIVRSYGQPFADASAVPAYLVSEAARKHVTVVLSGDGADEVFGGYRRQTAYRWSERLSFLGRGQGSFSSMLVKGLPGPKGFRTPYAFLHRLLRGVSNNTENRYFEYCMDGFSESERMKFFPSLAMRPGALDTIRRHLQQLQEFSETDQMLALDFFLTLHDDMLIKGDIASMTHSLEARCPFLDKRIVDWCFSLPVDVKIGNFNNKPILRALAKRKLPGSVASAPKRGFEIPIHSWLRQELATLTKDALLDPKGIVRGLMSEKDILETLRGETLDPNRWSRRIWTLLILAIWDRER